MDEEKYNEILEYAKLMRGRMPLTELAVDLGFVIYTDPDLQHLKEHEIREIVRHFINEI